MFPNIFSGFDFIFSAGPPIIKLGFIIILTIIVVIIIRGVTQWNRNNNSPVLTVRSKIVARRTAVSHDHHVQSGNMAANHFSTSTTYFVTFEEESGKRMEFRIPHAEFGLLAEGDSGQLTYQGTRYKSFERF